MMQHLRLNHDLLLMKNVRLLFCFIFSLMSFSSWAEDTVQLRVMYYRIWKVDLDDNFSQGQDMTLDIGETTSYFYYRDTVDHMKYPINDSRRYKQASYSVLKNIETGKLAYSESFSSKDIWFRYEEDMPQWEWELQEGDSIILGYPCKKAVASFRGRTWTAWYAIDLPYDNGPWKLCGLPGLILLAEESDRCFKFKCTGIAKGDGFVIAEEDHHYQKVKPKRMQEIWQMRYMDPDAFMLLSTGREIKTISSNIPMRERKPCLIEIFE